jgi:uncharacterized protein (DUF433 family)
MQFDEARTTAPQLGIGYYSVPDASRLLRVPARSIRRWLGGYRYSAGNTKRAVAPLWTPQLPRYGETVELGFRDLVELRFIKAFLDAGLNMLTIRNCLAYARECVSDERPFTTRQFKTDGKTIFLSSMKDEADEGLLDLRKRQFVIREIIERTFQDLDLESNAVVRWRPYFGKKSIVLDPARSFGQPIAAEFGIPTVVLHQAVIAEGDENKVAHLFECSIEVVRDAVHFEEGLLAA